ncbi:CapA family protein [Enhygromyxa salina]|uniref:Capsule biosynthesis protein CapA n=1 Tax=Enhygromyxa salina TaxID=215803 RepID=A0A2S9YX77_9BACT|nr:CapA family protein [Enhygromyxa salina]PRQ09687.1 Capsule biosynthesis protein CapA [Enhygromyxa salina]
MRAPGASARPALHGLLGALLLGSLLGCWEQRPPTLVRAAPELPVVVEPKTVAAQPEPAPEQQPPERAEQLELTFVGDVVLGRYLEARGEEFFAPMHAPADDPFAMVAPLLAADVVVGNLESPVMFEAPPQSPSTNKWRFGSSAAYIDQLVRGGFTVMSLANNHYFDLGVEGQLEGPQVLATAGLVAIGRSRTEDPLVRVETHEVRGWRIGFVAFATLRNHVGERGGPQLPFASLGQVREQLLPIIETARAEHDLLIVVVHWGTEYANDVSNSNKLAARALLEGGADLVIGHHPHVLQAIERHRSSEDRDGLIAYSLGNFLFPRNDHRPGMTGVLRVRYRDTADAARPCLEEARFHPAYIVRLPGWHPEPARGQRGRQVRQRLEELSASHGTKLVRTDEADGEDLLVTGLRACPSATPL